MNKHNGSRRERDGMIWSVGEMEGRRVGGKGRGSGEPRRNKTSESETESEAEPEKKRQRS